MELKDDKPAETSPSNDVGCSAASAFFQESDAIRQRIKQLAKSHNVSPAVRSLGLRHCAETAIFAMQSPSDLTNLQKLFGFVVGSILDVVIKKPE